MSSESTGDHLNERTVLLILSNITQELRESLPEQATTAVQSEEEARLALIALLNAAGENSEQIDIAAIIPDDAEGLLLSRGVLDLLLNDRVIHYQVKKLVDHPPEESQMSLELALAGSIILGALITWLQTKVQLRVKRKDGKTEFEFEMKKDGTDASIIKEVAQSVAALLKRIS